MGKTYVIGHRNPDTDSIGAAMGIAELKGMLGEEVIPARLGTLNEETKFATRYFDVEAPLLMCDARTVLKDIEMDEPVQISATSSANDAYRMITKTHNKTLFVTDEKQRIQGIVSMGDLASLKLKRREELDELLTHSNIRILAKDTDSEIVVSAPYVFKGTVTILSSMDDVIKPYSIILCRSKNIRHALIKQPSVIIFTEMEKEDFEQCALLAKQQGITILKSNKSLEELVLDIYYAIPLHLIMSKQVISYCTSQYVEDVKRDLMKTRFRSYPVVDEQGTLVGSISRYHLFNYQKNQFILVDHSSSNQSIHHLMESDIIEVVDHHHIGDIQTQTPINYYNRKCGSTCTIVYSMYLEQGLLPTYKVAGMMVSAIISDTLYFQSQTTTQQDVHTAYALAKICRVNVDQYAKELLAASVNLKDANIIELIERDLKEYHFGNYRIAVGQTNYSQLRDIQPRVDEFKTSIYTYASSKSYDIFIMMFTNVRADGTYFIYAGLKSSSMEQVLEQVFDACSGFDSRIMSRKQQLIPRLAKILEED